MPEVAPVAVETRRQTVCEAKPEWARLNVA
jgi:hypothetical protein